MSLVVYVAGASAELERATSAINLLGAAGFEVALDWTAHIRELGSAPGSAELRRAHAIEDEEAIERCGLLWLLVPHAGTRGAWWEAGTARALGRTVIASGARPDLEAAIFVELADARFAVTVSQAREVEAHQSRDAAAEARRRAEDLAFASAQERADGLALAWLEGRRHALASIEASS